jgi:hypothetical protein
VYQCKIEFLRQTDRGTMSEKIVRPSDIYVDSDGFLYISCFIGNCVKKFKLVPE